MTNCTRRAGRPQPQQQSEGNSFCADVNIVPHAKGPPPWTQDSTEPALLSTGPPLEEAPAVLDKPDVVYVVEGQPASVTVTFNHVEAQVVWRR